VQTQQKIGNKIKPTYAYVTSFVLCIVATKAKKLLSILHIVLIYNHLMCRNCCRCISWTQTTEVNWLFELEASQYRKSSLNCGSTGRDVLHISRLTHEKAWVVQNFSGPSLSMKDRRLSQHIAVMKRFFSLVFQFMNSKNYHKEMKVFLVPLDGFC